jgi:hypothetical protein
MSTQVSLSQVNSVQNGVFVLTFSVFNNQISQAFSKAIQDFGEPTISIGGLYTPGGSVPAFTLPTQVIRLISDLPFTIQFDPSNPILSSEYAQQQAAYFATQFIAAFNTAVTTLIATADTWTNQTIVNFPTS